VKRLVAATFVLLVSMGVAAPDAARKPVVIAPGVTVAGVKVGGLTSEPARTRVEKAFGSLSDRSAGGSALVISARMQQSTQRSPARCGPRLARAWT
jgi:hypothetical protein